MARRQDILEQLNNNDADPTPPTEQEEAELRAELVRIENQLDGIASSLGVSRGDISSEYQRLKSRHRMGTADKYKNPEERKRLQIEERLEDKLKKITGIDFDVTISNQTGEVALDLSSMLLSSGDPDQELEDKLNRHQKANSENIGENGKANFKDAGRNRRALQDKVKNAVKKNLNNPKLVKVFLESLVRSFYKDAEDLGEFLEDAPGDLVAGISWLAKKLSELDPKKLVEYGIATGTAAYETFNQLKKYVNELSNLSHDELSNLLSGNTEGLEDKVSPEILIAVDLAVEITTQITEHLENLSDEDIARIMGSIAGSLLFEGVLTAGLALGTAGIGAVARSGLLIPKLINKLKSLNIPGIDANLLHKVIDNAAVKAAKFLGKRVCFVAGTKIHTALGLKNIEEIKPGELVLTRSEFAKDTDHDIIYKPVLKTFRTMPDVIHHLEFKTKEGRTETISTTMSHLFYVVGKGWNFARNLDPGDICSLPQGGTATIVAHNIEQSPNGEYFTTYNFEVEEHHTYFVGEIGVWVHNESTDYCDALLSKMWKWQKANPLATDIDRIKFIRKQLEDDIKAGKISRAAANKHYSDILDTLSEANGWDVTAPIHHIASDKHATEFTEKFREIFGKGGLSLQSEFNKIPLPNHNSKHTRAYHLLVEKTLTDAINGKTSESEIRQAIVDALLKLKEELLKNPRLPFPDGGL